MAKRFNNEDLNLYSNSIAKMSLFSDSVSSSQMDRYTSGDDGKENLRNYQLELLNMAKNENIIACLPTGSGKTKISVELAKTYLEKCIGTSKKIVFAVNHVTLAIQQFNYFNSLIPQNVKSDEDNIVRHYHGNMVEGWSPQVWESEIKKAKIIVITSECLNQLLMHRKLKFEDIVLLILDECHHATKSHPMKKLIDEFYKPRKDKGQSLPRILGLTASLINQKIKSESIPKYVKETSLFLDAKAVTSRYQIDIKANSTKAEQFYLFYKSEEEIPTNNQSIKIVRDLIECLAKFTRNQLDLDPQLKEVMRLNRLTFGQMDRNKQCFTKILQNILVQIEEIYLELGPYCGRLVAKIILNQANAKKEFDVDFKVEFWNLVIEKLNAFINSPDMLNPSILPATEKLKLLDIYFRKFCLENENKPKAIVFVQKKLKTQTLYWYFKDLYEQKYSSSLNFGFMISVGFSTYEPINNAKFTMKMQEETLAKFRRDEINVIFSTSILEEGLDVASCNIVVRFDNILNYTSYVQSMGRARHKNSQFIHFIDSHPDNRNKSILAIKEYQKFQVELTNILSRNLYIVDDNDDCDTKDPNSLPPFCPGGTLDSPRILCYKARGVTETFCAKLTSDSYISRTFCWYDRVEGGVICTVSLPANSDIMDNIKGDVQLNKDLAKMSAYLKVCEKLYELGHLNNNLEPVAKSLPTQVTEFFEQEDSKSKLLNSTTGSLWFNKTEAIPLALNESINPIHPKTSFQVYSITFRVKYPLGIEKEKVFSSATKFYGLITAVDVVEQSLISEFHFDSSNGNIDVTLANVTSSFKKNSLEDNYGKIIKFQMLFFEKLLGLKLKCAKLKDNSSLLVVPLKLDGGMYMVSIDELDGIKEIESLSKYGSYVPPSERIHHKPSAFIDASVVPWHNYHNETIVPEVYAVTRFDETMSPLSMIEGKELSFKNYFDPSSSLNISNNPGLILCYKMSLDLNFLQSRARKLVQGSSKNSKAIQTYIPELVRIFPYSGALLCQSKLIPSVIQRLTRCLQARELGQRLSHHMNPNVKFVNKTKWELPEMPKEKPPQKSDLTPKNAYEPAQVSESSISDLGNDLNFIHPDQITPQIISDMMRLNRNYDTWSSIDTTRRVGEVPQQLVLTPLREIKLETLYEVRYAQYIESPPLIHLLEAITLSKSRDSLNLERLETMGDSFLKFATTLFLFRKFSKEGEGNLTEIRNNIVSNRALARVGEMNGIPQLLAYGIFYPEEFFLPPSYQVIENCAKVAVHLDRCFNIFSELTHEQLCMSSYDEILRVCEESDEMSKVPSSTLQLTTMEHGRLRVKEVGDGVEALIGAYFMTGGFEGALNLMKALGIRGPDADGNSVEFGPWILSKEPFYHTFMMRNIESVDLLTALPLSHLLEETIAYTFKNKWLLVEALTHGASIKKWTQSYQRLEFLGDSVLDFIITNYIFKRCSSLNPGQLTDLRSALVNNDTFGSITVKLALHKFLINDSANIETDVENFANFYSQYGYKPYSNYKLVDDGKNKIATDVDIPKVLGDIFESVVGAIFVDSDMDLDLTWRIVYRLMEAEIKSYSIDVPIAPLRRVEELGYKRAMESGESIFHCTLTDKEGRSFIGAGKNSKSARNAAAKYAMHIYYSEKTLES